MRKISSIIKSVIYVLIIAVTYYFRGYQANFYQGYMQLDLSSSYVFTLLLTVIFGGYLFSIKYKKPSDYFLLLYGMIVVIPYGVLYGLFNGVEDKIFVNLVILFLPILSLLVLCNLGLKLPKVSIISEDNLMRFILLSTLIFLVVLLKYHPTQASFSILDAYARRLEARDLYGSGTLISYFSGIVMNSALPMMIFFGVLRRKFSYILTGVLICFGVYYIYGVKAPFLYMLFGGAFAYYLKRPAGSIVFFNSVYYIFMSMFVFAWIEFGLFDYSYVEDFIIRRIFYVSSYLIGAYFSALSTTDFSWVSGLAVEKSPSFFIGENFLGLQGTNANTNTFLYFLLQYGLAGYVFSIGLVSGFLLILNSLRFRSDLFVFLSLIFTVLILEQSVTTALLSSGVGVMFLLFYFSRTNESCHPPH